MTMSKARRQCSLDGKKVKVLGVARYRNEEIDLL